MQSNSNTSSSNSVDDLQLVEVVLQHKRVTIRNPKWNITSICALLERSKVLKELVFSEIDTPIKDHGAMQLAEVLEHNSTLTNLDLSKNYIGDEGAKRLAEVLEHNSTLTNLNLSYNYIRDEGAKRLAEVLEHSSTLTTLDLSRNKIRDDGAKRLAEALECNTTLTNLNLSSNWILYEGTTRLEAALERNSALTTFDIAYNKVRDHVAKRWTEALAGNAAQQRLHRCSFVRMLVVLGNDVRNHGGNGSYWTRMPADLRRLLLEYVYDVWPAMGKTRSQMRRCAQFLLQTENIRRIRESLTGSLVVGFRVVEKVSSGAFEIRKLCLFHVHI